MDKIFAGRFKAVETGFSRFICRAAGLSAKREGTRTLYYITEARNRFAPRWRTIFLGFCVSTWYGDKFILGVS